MVTKEIKSVTAYLTKYVTKNKSVFNCQVWNCSKKISALYTDFYSDYTFLDKLSKIQGLEIKEKDLDFCSLKLFKLNETVMDLYEPLKSKNQLIWLK